MSEKSRIRARCRALRQNLPAAERRRLNARIGDELLAAAQRLAARSVGAFIAFDGEPDVGSALRDLAGGGVAMALPVLTESPRSIELHGWNHRSEMVENRYGIPEPRAAARIDPGRLDLLLVPLVAFDDRGSRLGMGAGLYDRLLAPVSQRQRPLRVGIAYEMQRVKRIPSDPWDVPLHAVITEAGWFSFGPQVGDNDADSSTSGTRP